VKKTELTVETKSGIKRLSLEVFDGQVLSVTVDMGPAVLAPEQIPVRLEGPQVVDRPALVGGREQRITCVSMGNPHCVIFETDVEGLALEERGACVETDPLFPESVNTEFVQVLDAHTLRMRVWERGSGETLACGTGSCAAAAVLHRLGLAGQCVRICHAPGDLLIRLTPSAIFMQGPAEYVYRAEWLGE